MLRVTYFMLHNKGMLGFAHYYIVWHYSGAIIDLIRIWGNLLWFFTHFFSIQLLLSTLFAPFQRITEKYKGGLHLDDFFSVIVVNILMRLVGFFMRMVIIIFGLLVLTTVLIGGAFIVVAWLLMPVLVFVLLSLGFAYLVL